MGCDGAATMSGKFNSLATLVINQYPNVSYIYIVTPTI